MYARIGTFDVPPDKVEAVTKYFHDEAVPAFSRHAGFLGYQAYVDRDKGRIIGISLWTTRAALETSTERRDHSWPRGDAAPCSRASRRSSSKRSTPALRWRRPEANSASRVHQREN